LADLFNPPEHRLVSGLTDTDHPHYRETKPP